MTDSYLVNLSFRAGSRAEAESFASRVSSAAEELEATGAIRDLKLVLSEDWLATLRRSVALRPAANKQLMREPSEDDD